MNLSTLQRVVETAEDKQVQEAVKFKRSAQKTHGKGKPKKQPKRTRD
jgi:hypothetical protein